MDSLGKIIGFWRLMVSIGRSGKIEWSFCNLILFLFVFIVVDLVCALCYCNNSTLYGDKFSSCIFIYSSRFFM